MKFLLLFFELKYLVACIIACALSGTIVWNSFSAAEENEIFNTISSL